MASNHASQAKLFFLKAFSVLLILIALSLVSVWADRESGEVEGPSRLVKGPDNTVYVQVERKIAKVSAKGELLSVLDLDTDLSVPDAADFYVEQDGRLLLARRDSGLLQSYSPEGKPHSVLLRLPLSEAGNHSRSLARDPSTGILYFADPPRHRILIFGPDPKEAGTITVPSGAEASLLKGGRPDASYLERVYSPETPLQNPQGVTFAGDRLIAADTGNARVIFFHPDGRFDRIIPVFPLDSSQFINPVKGDRFGDALYVLVRGPGFTGGAVQSFEVNTGLPRTFSHSGQDDPVDILVRRDDILVADRASLTVKRYSHGGQLLDIFGKPALQSLYANSRYKREMYGWLQKGSFAGMLGVFGWLLLAAAGRLAALPNALGPAGSVRRKVLLLIPGMGQAASGRPLRAVLALFALLYCASLFFYSWLEFRSQADAPLSLQMLVTTGFMAYSAWIFIVLDGIRLTGKPSDNEDPSDAKRRLQAALGPVITICAATAVQLARELAVQAYPGALPAVRPIFEFAITAIHGPSSLFSASLSASLVFGWGGAAAALFGAVAWQAKARRPEMATAIAAGFLAGMYSWLLTAVIAGNSLTWTMHALPLQGLLLGLFVHLYFRRQGMPALIVPAAAAGAWIGYMVTLFFGVLGGPIGKLLSRGDAAGLWTGAIARLELILMPAFFVHLALWITGTVAADRPGADAVAAIQNENGAIVSSPTFLRSDLKKTGNPGQP